MTIKWTENIKMLKHNAEQSHYQKQQAQGNFLSVP